MITPGALVNGSRTDWALSSALPPLGALTSAPATARAYVKGVLAEWQLSELADAAELVVSELVTNAVRASTDPAGSLIYIGGAMPVIRVCLMSDRHRLLVECWDDAPGLPVPRNVDPWTAESGRGLAMIAGLTNGDWGWSPRAGRHGKVVWAVLTAETP